MMRSRMFVLAVFVCGVSSTLFDFGVVCLAQESRVPRWDVRGTGLLPAQGIACVDVSDDGEQIAVGTIALPGQPNVHVFGRDGALRKSYTVGQRWIAQVAAVGGDKAFALCTMPTGAAGDEPQVFFCDQQVSVVNGTSGGTSLFHYGDHSNHIGKQIARHGGVVASVAEGLVAWSSGVEPDARSPVRNLKVTAMAVSPRDGSVIVGGYVDQPIATAKSNAFLALKGSATPAWQREIVRDVGTSEPPEKGEYGRPMLPDGSRNPLPQRDEELFAPLAVAINRAEGAERRVAFTDYRGWRRWIRSSGSGKEEDYGTRFTPAKPTVTVYDADGKLLRRFGPEQFAHRCWVDLAFTSSKDIVVAFPHRWACRGLSGQTSLPADDHASTMWLLNVADGSVVPVDFPDAIASLDISDADDICVSCWSGKVYCATIGHLMKNPSPPAPLPAKLGLREPSQDRLPEVLKTSGLDIGGPALVKFLRGGDASSLVAAKTNGELVIARASRDVQRVELTKQENLNQLVPQTENPRLKNAKATPIAKGLWQMPGGRAESDLGGQRVIEGTDGLILIEGHAGLSFETEWAGLEAAGLDPRRVKYVLTTHEHGDHSPGAYLWRVATGAQFICSREMAYTLQHHLPVGTGYGLHPPVPTDIKLDDDTMLDLCGVKVAGLRLPGHTFGSMGWLFEREGKRFVAIGDLIMPDGVLGYAGSINFSPYQVLESLRKLDDLKVDTILPGHGPVVGPDKYVASGISVATRVGWGKMKASQPDPRFRLNQPNVLVTAFLSEAVSAAFGDIDANGTPDVAVVSPRGDGSVAKVFLNEAARAGRFDPMQPSHEIDLPMIGNPNRVRVLDEKVLAASFGTTQFDPKRPVLFVSGQSMTAFLVPKDGPKLDYDVHPVSGTEVHQARFLDTGSEQRPVLLGRFSGANVVLPGRDRTWITQPFKPELKAPYLDARDIDLNGDGRPDLLVNTGSIWLRTEAGPLAEMPSLKLPLPVSGDWHFVTSSDFNGDRRPDVAMVSYGSGAQRQLSVFLNTGDAASPFGTEPANKLAITTTQPHVRDSAVTTDWNNDGFMDLVYLLGQDNQVRIYFGSQTGLKSEQPETIPLDLWSHYEHPATVADFNNDGQPDLAFFGYTRTGVGAGGPPAAYVWLKPKP